MPSLIQPDLRIDGTLTAQGDIEIRGHVEGDIRAANLRLGKEGIINGNILTGAATVEGHFNGEILARDVRICAGANVRGRIESEKLTVEFGAVLENRFAHSPSISQSALREDPAVLLFPVAVPG